MGSLLKHGETEGHIRALGCAICLLWLDLAGAPVACPPERLQSADTILIARRCPVEDRRTGRRNMQPDINCGSRAEARLVCLQRRSSQSLADTPAAEVETKRLRRVLVDNCDQLTPVRVLRGVCRRVDRA